MEQINIIRKKVVKDIMELEQERHRLFFPVEMQSSEKIARYNYVTKYQRFFLEILEEIDDKEYVTEHINGTLSRVLPELYTDELEDKV